MSVYFSANNVCNSAMLVVKNLVEAGVKHVVNFYRSDFVFEHQTPTGSYRYKSSTSQVQVIFSSSFCIFAYMCLLYLWNESVN